MVAAASGVARRQRDDRDLPLFADACVDLGSGKDLPVVGVRDDDDDGARAFVVDD